jgi:hypothetical protein
MSHSAAYDPAYPTTDDEMYDPAHPTSDNEDEMYDPAHPTSDNEGEMYDPAHPTTDTEDEMYDPAHPTSDNEDEMYDPAHPTSGSDDEMADAVPGGQQPVQDLDAYWAGLWAQEGIDPDNDRLQTMASGFLWHFSSPYDYLDPATLEFIQWSDGTRQGTYYRNADRFLMQNPQWTHIWLAVDSSGSYDATVHTSAPDPSIDSIYVPWQHVAQHIYECCDLTVKEKHAFWPWGTTEQDVVGYLVDALNNGSVQVDGSTAYVVYDGNDVKTFFLARPDGEEDVYTGPEMDDIAGVFR